MGKRLVSTETISHPKIEIERHPCIDSITMGEAYDSNVQKGGDMLGTSIYNDSIE